MNILGRNKSGSDQEKALKQSDVGAWLKALTDAQTNGGGEVWCFWGMTVKGGRSHVVNYTIDEVLEHDNFFEMVQKKKGPGFYRFEIMDNDNPPKKLSEHHFTIGDLSKKTKKKDEDGEEKKSKKTTDMIMEKLLDAVLLNKTSNDSITTKDLLEMQMGMQKTAMESQQKSFEMMSAMMGGGGGNGQFEGFLQGVEFYKSIAPQMEKEEPLTALALGGLNMLSQMVGRGSPAPAGQQRVPSMREAKQLKAYAEKVLSGEVQEHAQPPGENNARPAVVPPQTTGAPGVRPADSAGEPRPESPTAGQREAAFYVSFIEPFSAACANEPDALDLAEKLLIMYNYTRQFMAEAPHPLMADFLASGSITDFQNAFINFCGAIPELRENKALQAEIAKFLAPVLQQMIEGQEGQEYVTEADTAIIGTTEAETESSDENSGTGEVIDPEVEHEDVPS